VDVSLHAAGLKCMNFSSCACYMSHSSCVYSFDFHHILVKGANCEYFRCAVLEIILVSSVTGIYEFMFGLHNTTFISMKSKNSACNIFWCKPT
jgi:hypothetical protein